MACNLGSAIDFDWAAKAKGSSRGPHLRFALPCSALDFGGGGRNWTFERVDLFFACADVLPFFFFGLH